jgi:long-subunit fatty acid transport protein
VFGTNTIYLANLATLAAEHFLTPKLLLSGRLFGGNGEYFEKARKVNGSFDWRTDWVWAYSLGVEYQIQKWLGVSADYTHARRDSNFDNFDFKDDIVGAKVTLSF